METQAQYLDNTMLSGYKDCPRKYYLRHVLGWRSEGTAIPLVFGLSWHDAQDVVWKHAKAVPAKELEQLALAKFCETWEANGLPVEPGIEQLEWMGMRTPSVAHDMLHHYIETRWKMLQEAELLACEQPFAVPLPELPNVWYIGRLDKVVRYNGETLVIEHKTTTAYKKDGGFLSSYIEGWYSDSQCKGYQYGGALFFPGLTQVWVDAALVHKTVHNAFRFVPVAHQFNLLQEFLRDTVSWVNRINEDTIAEYFPKNENACMGKFGACTFLNICRTTSDPGALAGPPAGYMVDRWTPFDLLGIDQILTKHEAKQATQQGDTNVYWA